MSAHGFDIRSNAGPVAAVEPASDAEIKLWNKEAIEFARDLLFVIAIFAYLIGFAFHSAAMYRFGIETNLSDQPLTSLVTYASDAIQEGWPGFALIFSFVLGLMLLAGYCKHALTDFHYYRPVVYGLVTVTVVSGLILSYAWSSKAGLCMAERKWFDAADIPRIRLFPMNGVTFQGFSSDPHAPSPVQLLAETNDTYQVLVDEASPTGPAAPLPIAIPRSQVRSIEYQPNLGPPSGHTPAPVPVDGPTPGTALTGSEAAPVAELSDCIPGMAR